MTSKERIKEIQKLVGANPIILFTHEYELNLLHNKI